MKIQQFDEITFRLDLDEADAIQLSEWLQENYSFGDYRVFNKTKDHQPFIGIRFANRELAMGFKLFFSETEKNY